ncbi:aminodeoxychorismate lyase [Nesterenkonia sp. MY13]|uniref:Aminodeoxychorismate lyase n=1 Tax=Nesterenkonia sedimenti TaxID=1463632 RepID=A0A7X8YD78_9MICC|nr:aminotransferase class IV [Nesterenkonia sedimenti]NLS09368.1 aminodeoxychorismate lyase [Nesterenkonia sedimenti]
MAERFGEHSLKAVGVRIDAEHPEGFIFDPHQPQLRVTDLGSVRGDGIFETMLVLDGKLRKLQPHLDRLARSAEITEIGIPPEESWRAAIDRGLEEFKTRGGGGDNISVRLTATRGVDGEPASEDPRWAGTYWVLLTPVPEKVMANRLKPISVTLLDRGYDSKASERAPWLLLSAKTLSYAVNMAAYRWAAQHGFDDVIFYTSDGQVLEAPTSTVLLLTKTADGTPKLTTPTLKTGILPGTSQGSIFAAAERAGWELGYGPITPEDLKAADHLWLASSLRLVSPIERIDDTEFATDEDYTAQLLDFLKEDLASSYPQEG